MDQASWQISEVAVLLSMDRRMIQRSCGTRRSSGDMAIVHVEGSAPGRRSYTAQSIEELNLVRELLCEGRDLAEVRRAFETARSAGGLCDLRQSCRERCLERAEDARAWLLRESVLEAGGGEKPVEDVGRILEREVASHLVRAGEAGPFPTGWLCPAIRRAAEDGSWPATWKDPAPGALIGALALGGMDLAVELMCGPNTYERVIGALEEAIQEERR